MNKSMKPDHNSFESTFKRMFDKGVSDIKFFVRRGGKVVTADDLRKDALAFQFEIEAGDVKEVESVD